MNKPMNNNLLDNLEAALGDQHDALQRIRRYTDALKAENEKLKQDNNVLRLGIVINLSATLIILLTSIP